MGEEGGGAQGEAGAVRLRDHVDLNYIISLHLHMC